MQATYRQWRRYLYRRVRMRIFLYRKEKERQSTLAEEQRQEREETWASETPEDCWKRIADEKHSDCLSEIHDTRQDRRLREPAKEKPRKRNAEYRRRKKEKLRQKKKQRKLAEQGLSCDVSEAGAQSSAATPLSITGGAAPSSEQAEAKSEGDSEPSECDLEPGSATSMPSSDQQMRIGEAMSLSDLIVDDISECSSVSEVETANVYSLTRQQCIDRMKKWHRQLQPNRLAVETVIRPPDSKDSEVLSPEKFAKLRVTTYEVETDSESEDDLDAIAPEVPASSSSDRPPFSEAGKISLAGMIHWQDGIVISKRTRKQWFDPIFLGPRKITNLLDAEDVVSESPRLVSQVLRGLGVFPEDFPFEDRMKRDIFVDTPGAWIKIDVPQYSSDAWARYAEDPQNAHANWETAYHGTSVHNLGTILRYGFSPGPNVTAEKHGVYCEREARRNSCMHYVTHSLAPNMVEDALLVFGAVLECVVDRAVGSTIHRQWVQPQNSIFVRAVLVHVARLQDVMNPGYKGLFRIFTPMLQSLMDSENDVSKIEDPRVAVRSGAAVEK